jgi:hypothetical protein
MVGGTNLRETWAERGRRGMHAAAAAAAWHVMASCCHATNDLRSRGGTEGSGSSAHCIYVLVSGEISRFCMGGRRRVNE